VTAEVKGAFVTDDRHWLNAAVDLATTNVADGGGPFGAVVVRDQECVASGVNRVTAQLDPTAHAEVLAIRAACRVIGDFSLAGLTLYSSCEPCPLCAAACLWARLDRVVYAADREDAAAGGFDDGEFYDLLARDRSQWPTPIQPLRVPTATAPFEAWAAHEAKVTY
jgi:guanine deaminase